MGEAFQRARAKAFAHQRNEARGKLVQLDLLKWGRQNEVGFELSLVSIDGPPPPVGSRVLVIPTPNNGHAATFGNQKIAELRAADSSRLTGLACDYPTLQGSFPFTVDTTNPFGGFTLKPERSEK